MIKSSINSCIATTSARTSPTCCDTPHVYLSAGCAGQYIHPDVKPCATCRPDRGSSGSNSHDRQVSGRPGDEKAFLRAQRPLGSLRGYGSPRQPGSEPWAVYGRVRADEKATETGLLAKTRHRHQHPRYVSTDQLILCPTENSCTEPTSRQPPLFPSCHIAYLLVLASCVSSGYL